MADDEDYREMIRYKRFGNHAVLRRQRVRILQREYAPWEGKPEERHIDYDQSADLVNHEIMYHNDNTLLPVVMPRVTYNDLPIWYDEELYEVGKNYALRHLYSMHLQHLYGLVAVLSLPAMMEAIEKTPAPNDLGAAYNRYAQILVYIYTLYTTDINDPSSKWYETINTIRSKYALYLRRCCPTDNGGVFARDVAVTQFAFLGYAIIIPELLGLPDDFEGKRGLIHFWRVTGYMLGIPNRLNMCRKTVQETSLLMKLVARNTFRLHMGSYDKRFFEVATLMLNSLWYMDFTINPESLISDTYELSGSTFRTDISWYANLHRVFRRYVIFNFLLSQNFGGITRFWLNLIVRFTFWMIQNCPGFQYLFFGRNAILQKV